MDNVTLSLIPAIGMILVAIAAVVYWRWTSKLAYRWFWVGAGLWAVAVLVKVAIALLCNKTVLGIMRAHLSYPLMVLSVGVYIGIESSLCEMGFTFVAVLIWRRLGRDPQRAIGIGIGAGAVEAFLLGLSFLASVIVCLAGLPNTQAVRAHLDAAAVVTPLFWLVAPVERVIAIACHAASRGLVLLGTARRKFMMVFGGFLLFTMVDAIAGAVQISGKMGKISMWWIELALVPFGLASVLIIRWLLRSFPSDPVAVSPLEGPPPSAPSAPDTTSS